MPSVGLEPTTPMFERAKTVHVLDSAANVIGIKVYNGGQKIALRIQDLETIHRIMA
jgi:hypothetical protein